MRSISIAAVAVALAAGGVGVAAPAVAQKAKAAAPAKEAAPRKFSKEGQKAIVALSKVVEANDAAGYPAALAAAEAAAKTPDDRYAIAQLKLNQALSTKDEAAQAAAIDAMLASGGARTEDLDNLYASLAGLNYNLKRLDQSAAALDKLIERNPNGTDNILKLAELRAEQKRNADAVALVERAISISKAAGQPIPENWYKRGLQLAYEAKLAPQTSKLSLDLLNANPKPENWRSALLIFGQTAKLDQQGELDLLRLMRQAKAMNDPNDYLALAELLDEFNYPAEAQAVVTEGTAAGKIKTSTPQVAELLKRVSDKVAEDKAALAPLESRARSEANGRIAMRLADGYFGHGDYAKAAELYRLAVQKGSVDADLINTRLGIALALAGQKAEAETAFKAVAGPRQGLADYWRLWLSKRG